MSEKKNNLKNSGKKGGTQFPKFSLKHLLPFLKGLISKTHSNSINIEQLNAGVFGINAKSKTGQIKSSSLKQFGLIEGDYSKFTATELASNIAMSEDVQQKSHLQDAFFKVKSFTNSFTTFNNTKIEKSRIAQYAVSTLKVHPDLKDEFVKVLIESAEISGLVKVEGSSVFFEKSASIPMEEISKNEVESDEPTENLDENFEESINIPNFQKKQGVNSNINVSIDVNSSMDPEKLEKLLKLLKGYGAI